MLGRRTGYTEEGHPIKILLGKILRPSSIDNAESKIKSGIIFSGYLS
jgi:hypothetical protein